MKDKINALKKNLILLGIRIKSFITEHKIASGAISLLLVSAIVVSVMVNAEETIEKVGHVSNATIALASDELSNESFVDGKALNFSTVYYNLQYRIDDGKSAEQTICRDGSTEVKPNVDTVTITARLGANANAAWAYTDETSESTISDDRKTITINVHNVAMCSSPQQVLPITILNANKEDIKPTSVTIKAGTEATSTTSVDNIPKIPTTWSETVKLKAKVQSGIMNASTKEGKFGIILGLDKNDVTDGSLKGKYITTSENDLYLAAALKQSDDTTVRSEVDLKTTAGTFGKYEARLKYFSNLLMPELSTSGITESLAKNTKGNVDTTVNKTVTIYGTSELEYSSNVSTISTNKVDETYINNTKCSFSNSNCIIDSTITEKGGNSYIKYTYTSGNDTITYLRKITKSSSFLGTLAPKHAKFLKNSTMLDSYVNNITSNSSNSTICYKSGDDDICNAGTSTIDDSTSQDIPISVSWMKEHPNTYYVKTGTGEDTITYEIEVLDSTNYTSLDNKNANFSGIPASMIVTKGSTYTACAGLANCTSNPSNVDTSTKGEKEATLTITSGDVTLSTKQTVTVEDLFYKLTLNNVGYDGDLTYIDNADMYAVGSYFITTNSISGITGYTSTDKLCLSASSGEIYDKSTLCIKTDNSGTGTNDVQNSVYVVEDGEYVRVAPEGDDKYYTAAMGEEIEQEVIFSYGYDASGPLTNGFTAKIKVPKQYLRPIAYENTINDTEANKLFVHVDQLNENIDDSDSASNLNINYNVSYKTSTGNITPTTGDATYDDVEEITVNVTSSISPGTTLRFKLKYVVKPTIANVGQAFRFGTVGENDGEFTLPGGSTKLATIPTSEQTYVTPYKLRSHVKFGTMSDDDEDNNVLREADDLTFDASKNDTYTGAVFPDAIAPALDISTTSLGYTTISKIPLKITLPKGINYVYNKNYSPQEDGTNPKGIDAVIPTVTYNSDGTTTLSYNYEGVEPNSWIKPLYFDFNIDVTTETSTKDIVVELGDGIKTGIDHDSSSDMFTKSTHKLNIENTYDVAYGQYLYNKTESNGGHYISNADVGEGFVQTIKVKNNSSNPATGVYAYAIVPNDVSSNETKFAGSFDVAVPSGAKCIESSSSITASALAKDRVIENLDENLWKDCSSIDKTKLIGYRVYFSSIEPGGIRTADATYTVKDNGAADNYEFDAFLKYTMTNAQASGTYIPMHSVSLEVISKKIRGVVFEDFIVNGIMDKNEKTLEGVTLKLYNSSGTDTGKVATSNRNGVYTFSGLSEGKYYVVADFNTEKYGLTTKPSQDFYDKSVISVFREDSAVVENNESLPTTNESTTGETGDTTTGDTTTEGSEPTDDNTTIDTQTDEGIIIVSPTGVVRTDDIDITSETRIYDYVNLGLTPRKKFQPRITKYVSKAIVTDALGVQTIKDYKNAKIAKLDVRNMAKVKIKVVYTLEITNTMYYPGYVKKVLENIPTGMSFNKDYAENKGWKLTEDGILENDSLASTALNENDKKYITVAFDITSQEAGSFVNMASIDDLQIMGGVTDE